MITAAELAKALNAKRAGDGWLAKCPAHEDSTPSFSFTDKNGKLVYKCHAGCTQDRCTQALKDRGYFDNGHRANGHARELVHPELGKPQQRYDYFDADGKLRFVVCRWDFPDRPKEIRPAVPTGEGWRWKGYDQPRPPYRLRQAIAETDCGILIVEGEKKADIAAKLFLEYVVVGWCGGAAAWAKTDWSTLPGGRDIVIWPDNDPAGLKAATGIASVLPGTRVVDVAALGLPPHFDLGDPIPETLDYLEAVRSARAPVKIGENYADPISADLPAPWEPPGETLEPRRFVLTPFSSLTAPADPYYLVKGILPRRGLAVIWGPPKCGKSFWTFDILMHVARQIDYRGLKVKGGPVVYIACEGGDYFGARVEAYRQTFLAEDADIPFFLIKGSLDLLKDHTRLAREIAEQCPAPAAVVIDTVNTSLDGSEIDDMPAYTRAAKFLGDALRALVAVVHHCGTAGERPRGHTSLTANCDAQIAVAKADTGLVTCTVEFMKDGSADAVIQSKIQVVDLGSDIDGDPITSCVIEPAESGSISTRKPPLRGNLASALSILAESMPAGMTQDDWYSAMRADGIGTKRAASLGDCKRALLSLKRIHEYNGRYFVRSNDDAG